MPMFPSLTRVCLRLSAALLDLGVLGYLVFRTGPGVVWKQLQSVGWGLAVIIILGGFSQLIRTCAWRQALMCDALVGAVALEGLTKVINLVGALNPGNLGTYEGGNMLIANIFGVTSTAGLTLALCRRARTLFWAGIGAMSLILINRAKWAKQNTGEGP